ncbi:ATP-dependent Clp protease ATP-binding subunit, partial [Priestia megaterium]|uniref:ATP-dependent Clp protease ATP-binding subunit n=1 Tax=Priestia megaterium TaxID=1404 RepID=UPI002E218B9E|nr:ATP-dependent Clp protease ATP-binding subunit [Priestia megaterium]
MTLELNETREEITPSSDKSGKGHLQIENSDVQENYLIDYAKEVQKSYKKVFYREKEIEHIIQLLGKKDNNNPILLGDSGVGKNSIVSSIAYGLSNGDYPSLVGYKIYSLDIDKITAGVTRRLDFDKRVKETLDRLSPTDILFINDVHIIIGSGKVPANGFDISPLLKTYIKNKSFKILGVTTTQLYKKNMEGNPLFDKYLLPVEIKPLSKEQTFEVLKEVSITYEEFHNVKITDGSISLIVNLDNDYMKNRNFPEKALDILDEASSATALYYANKGTYNSNPSYEKFIILDNSHHLGSLGEDIIQHFNAKGVIKETIEVTEDTIIKIVERMTNIPVSKLTLESKNRLTNLEPTLNKKLIGQSEAVKALARAVKRRGMGWKKRDKPVVLFFAGPTGVGKTESVKVLAETLYDSKKAMIRFDMSEYAEPTSVTKLIGASPGYLGYDQGGALTEKVYKTPHSIILLDEFEKAHPTISETFLQVFDDGILTDSKDKNVDFSQTIIILTSNIG